MVAAYIREKLAGPASEAAVRMADVGDKGIEYSTGKPRETVWWLWLILKSFIVGNRKENKKA